MVHTQSKGKLYRPGLQRACEGTGISDERTQLTCPICQSFPEHFLTEQTQTPGSDPVPLTITFSFSCLPAHLPVLKLNMRAKSESLCQHSCTGFLEVQRRPALLPSPQCSQDSCLSPLREHRVLCSKLERINTKLLVGGRSCLSPWHDTGNI